MTKMRDPIAVARNEALEEAAKLADRRNIVARGRFHEDDWDRGYRKAAGNIAAAIRALKTPEPE